MSLFKVEEVESQKFLKKSLLLGMSACTLLAFMIFTASPANAQARYASSKRSNAAIAHYARARAMCVETLEEFEVGRKHARPDLLLDPEEWRLTMISLCEQLNRLVDPKIRVSNDGIQVSANPRMISRAEDKLPQVVDGPKIRNDYGELKRLKEKQDARARMYAPEKQEENVEVEQAGEPTPELSAEEQQLSEEELIERAIQEAIDSEAPEVVKDDSSGQELATEEMSEEQPQLVEEKTSEESAPEEEEIINARPTPQTEVNEIPTAEQDLSATEKEPENNEDAKIATAIEQAIQNRLREIESAEGDEDVVASQDSIESEDQ